VNYTLADGSEGTASIAKISKGTYCNWDVLQLAGLSERATDIRTLSLLNNNSGGEVRIYDMYIRIPDNSTTDVSDIKVQSPTVSAISYYDLNGCRLSAPQRGLTIVKLRMSDGTTQTKKVW